MSTPTNDVGTKKPDPTRILLRLRELTGITQVKGSLEVVGAPEHPPFAVKLAANQTAMRLGDEGLQVVAEYEFSGFNSPPTDAPASAEEQPSGEPFVHISATYVAHYALEPGEQFSDADAQAFAFLNGTLNTYPYWREFVWTSLGRAELPPYHLPIFNPTKMARELQQDQEKRDPA